MRGHFGSDYKSYGISGTSPQKKKMDHLIMAFIIASFFLVNLPDFALSDPNTIGVNIDRIANNLPAADKVIELLKSEGFNRVKLSDGHPTVLKALAGSGIEVIVTLPNKHLYKLSRRRFSAYSWVRDNIYPYYPATQIHTIAVGNVNPKNTTTMNFLLPAMKNIQAALVYYKLDSAMKVSFPIDCSALQSSCPPSSGAFKKDLVEPVIKPMLEFIRQTGSYLMVNIYPFSTYESNSDVISLDYALFRENPGVVDSGNGLHYSNMFDAQIDAVYAAMKVLKYEDLKVVVSGTGWPSKGDEKEAGASVENAAAYNGNLVRKVLSGSGTPLKPENNLDIYLFALFNENNKPGPTSERNYGLFYPNGEKVYDIPLTAEGIKGRKSTPVNGGKVEEQGRTKPGNGGEGGSKTSSLKKTGCVANDKSGEKALQKALNCACDQGRADCHGMQPGVVDSRNVFRYPNLFDSQIDVVYAAMDALNYKDLKIVVTETGWPSKGDEMEIEASEEDAAEYDRNLVRRVLSGSGTPSKPKNGKGYRSSGKMGPPPDPCE